MRESIQQLEEVQGKPAYGAAQGQLQEKLRGLTRQLLQRWQAKQHAAEEWLSKIEQLVGTVIALWSLVRSPQSLSVPTLQTPQFTSSS